MTATPPVLSPQVAKARLGNAVRNRRGDEAVRQARTELAEANLAVHIRRIVDAAPPLSPTQKERLAALILTPCTERDGTDEQNSGAW